MKIIKLEQQTNAGLPVWKEGSSKASSRLLLLQQGKRVCLRPENRDFLLIPIFMQVSLWHISLGQPWKSKRFFKCLWFIWLAFTKYVGRDHESIKTSDPRPQTAGGVMRATVSLVPSLCSASCSEFYIHHLIQFYRYGNWRLHWVSYLTKVMKLVSCRIWTQTQVSLMPKPIYIINNFYMGNPVHYLTSFGTQFSLWNGKHYLGLQCLQELKI